MCLKNRKTFIINFTSFEQNTQAFYHSEGLCYLFFFLQSNSSSSIHTDLRSDLVKSAHLKRFAHHFKHNGKGQTRHHADHTIYCKPHGQPAAGDHATSTSLSLERICMIQRDRRAQPRGLDRSGTPHGGSLLFATHESYRKEAADRLQHFTIQSPDKNTHGWLSIIPASLSVPKRTSMDHSYYLIVMFSFDLL